MYNRCQVCCWDAVCFGPVQRRRRHSAEERKTTMTSQVLSTLKTHFTFTINILLFERCTSLTSNGNVRERSSMCNFEIFELARIWQSRRAMPQHEPFLTFCTLWTVGEKTGSTSVSYERYQTLEMAGWGEGGMCKSESEFECVGEGETLEATGYLSRYNGVSYEKTSVNFLSDLQQSITQSSHSADLWSCCLTESCHCSQPPTHRNSNFGLTNFPCNAIQLFFSLSLSQAHEAGDLCIFKSKEQSLGNAQGWPGVTRGGTGHFTFYQPTLNALIQP